MNTQHAILVIQKHSPLPAKGTYHVSTFQQIGEAFASLLQNPADAAIPILLEAVDEESDLSLVASAAHVLAAQPKNAQDSQLADLPRRALPVRWMLEIYLQLPDYASLEHLKDLLESESDEELADEIKAAIDELSGVEHPDEVDAMFRRSMKEHSMPKACRKADEAFQQRLFLEVERILAPYQDILPPVYLKKLDIARRKLS